MNSKDRIALDISISERGIRTVMVVLLLLAGARNISSTQDVRLSTYYPVPNGLYQQMMTTGSTYLAPNTNAGNYVDIGAVGASPAKNASLVLPAGGVALGSNNAGSGTNALHVGAQVPGGQGSIGIVNGGTGLISKGQDSLEVEHSQEVDFGGGGANNVAQVQAESGGQQQLAVNGVLSFEGAMTVSGPIDLAKTGGTVPHQCGWQPATTQTTCSGNIGPICLAVSACNAPYVGCSLGCGTWACDIDILCGVCCAASLCSWPCCGSAASAYTAANSSCPPGTKVVSGQGSCSGTFANTSTSMPQGNAWAYGCSDPISELTVGLILEQYTVQSAAFCCQDGPTPP